MLDADDVPNVEVGVQVSSSVAPTGPASTFPGGLVASATHYRPDRPRSAILIRRWANGATRTGTGLAGRRWIYGHPYLYAQQFERFELEKRYKQAHVARIVDADRKITSARARQRTRAGDLRVISRRPGQAAWARVTVKPSASSWRMWLRALRSLSVRLA